MTPRTEQDAVELRPEIVAFVAYLGNERNDSPLDCAILGNRLL